MKRHTTHYDDCGCKTARLTERIEKLRDEIRLAIKETSQHYTIRRLGLALADDTAKMFAADDKAKGDL